MLLQNVFLYLQALRYLGLEPNENQNKELYDRLNIDENDTVEYGGKIILAVVEITVIWLTSDSHGNGFVSFTC